jgi:hypothetical protein
VLQDRAPHDATLGHNQQETTMPRTLLPGLLCAFALLACHVDNHHGDDDGEFASEERTVGHFDRIAISGRCDLSVKVEPGASTRVVVNSDGGAIEDVTTKTSNGKLRIDDSGGFGGPVLVSVRVGDLRGIDVSGTGQVRIWGVDADEFDLDVSGAADVRVAGVADVFDCEIRGTAKVEAQFLHAERSEIEVSGAADVGVCANDALEIEVSGTADVDWWGLAVNVDEQISGAGSVKHRGKNCPVTSAPADSTTSSSGASACAKAKAMGKSCSSSSSSSGSSSSASSSQGASSQCPQQKSGSSSGCSGCSSCSACSCSSCSGSSSSSAQPPKSSSCPGSTPSTEPPKQDPPKQDPPKTDPPKDEKAPCDP